MVSGLDRLRQRLGYIPARTRIALEQVMLEGANEIVAAARLRVPVGTGELRDSIHRTGIRKSRKGEGFYVAVTAGHPTEDGRYNLARLVEFGTVDTPAQPFMLPAYRASRARIRKKMVKVFRDAIED